MPSSAAPPRRTLGRHHPLLKRVRAMVRSGELREGAEVLLETPKLIQDALASGVRMHHVLIRADASTAAQSLACRLARHAPVSEIPPHFFSELTTTEASPGILALAEEPVWSEDDLRARSPLVLLVLAGLQDPGNLGAILRTAEAFGASGVVLTRGTVSPYSAKAIRAASGTLFRLPFLLDWTAGDVLRWAQQHNLLLLGAAPSGGRWLESADASRPLAVALGSEGGGLPRELKQAALPVSIPMVQSVESLNVAAAAAVLLYEISRLRRDKERNPKL